jgi:hypothetical protein
MLILLAAALSTVLAVTAWSMAGRRSADLGSVSHQWIAAYNASRPASSQ